jgi:hypothetical protein
MTKKVGMKVHIPILTLSNKIIGCLLTGSGCSSWNTGTGAAQVIRLLGRGAASGELSSLLALVLEDEDGGAFSGSFLAVKDI